MESKFDLCDWVVKPANDNIEVSFKDGCYYVNGIMFISFVDAKGFIEGCGK